MDDYFLEPNTGQLFDDIEYEKIVLEKIRYGMIQVIDEKYANVFASDPRIRVYFDNLYHQIVTRIDFDIFADKVETKEVKFPSTWRDAFKERWFPDWLKKRYPVRYTHVKLEAQVIYPKIRIPDQEHYVHIVKTSYKS